MATPYPWWWSKKKKWSAKQHILAALVGALVAIAVVAGTSVSLAPAHIFFSIANATTSTVPAGGGGTTTLYNGFYNFTLVTNNTSWHTKAHFATLSAQIWFSTNGYIVAEDVNTTAALPGWQGPRNVTNVEVYAEYGQYDKKEDNGGGHGPAPPPPPPPPGEQGQRPPGEGEAGSNSPSTNNQSDNNDNNDDAEKATRQDCRVVVEPKVWFKHVYGLVPTAPYTIRVNCFHVNFSNTTKAAVQCTH